VDSQDLIARSMRTGFCRITQSPSKPLYSALIAQTGRQFATGYLSCGEQSRKLCRRGSPSRIVIRNCFKRYR